MTLCSQSLAISDEINVVGVVVSFLFGVSSVSIAYATLRATSSARKREGTNIPLHRSCMKQKELKASADPESRTLFLTLGWGHRTL